MNYVRTALLLAALTGLFMAVGYAIGRESGMVIAFFVALATNLFAYWNSDRMVLSMHGAQQVDRASAPEFYELVEQLAGRANLPMPKVYIMDNPQPNAFATGRNPQNAAVAATTGLLTQLSREEAAGVIAHELAHVRNRDTLIMTLTATIAGAISMLGNFAMFFGGGRNREGGGLGPVATIAMIVLAPIAAMISRTREYAADRGGAEISGEPLWLASALQRIDSAAHQIENQTAEENPASAPLFIINPLSGARMDNLFSTHPATENRIEALMTLAQQMGKTRPGRHGEGLSEPAAGTSDAPPGPWDSVRERNGPWG